jgi:hypothetical protein
MMNDELVPERPFIIHHSAFIIPTGGAMNDGPSEGRSPVAGGIARTEQFVGDLAAGVERLAEGIAPAGDRELIQRALDLSARKKFLLARRLWTDERVQTAARLPMVLGTIYLLLPIHLLPARFGPFRQWEKLIGLAVLLWVIVRIAPEEVLREHLDAVDRPGLLRRVLKRDT